MNKSHAQIIADAIENCFTADGNQYTGNIADAVVSLGMSIQRAAKHLGVGEASTPFGAIESLGISIKDGCEAIATGLHAVAEAINNPKRGEVDASGPHVEV